jgi:hypothetical protein
MSTSSHRPALTITLKASALMHPSPLELIRRHSLRDPHNPPQRPRTLHTINTPYGVWFQKTEGLLHRPNLGCLLRKQRFRGVLTVISTAPIRPDFHPRTKKSPCGSPSAMTTMSTSPVGPFQPKAIVTEGSIRPKLILTFNTQHHQPLRTLTPPFPPPPAPPPSPPPQRSPWAPASQRRSKSASEERSPFPLPSRRHGMMYP